VTIPKAVLGTAADVVRDTDSATASIGAGIGGSETDAVKTYVDAYITITPAEATNNVGEQHTFTVTVKKDLGDGNGFVVADDGHVDVTLTGSGGIADADISVDASATTCDEPNDNLDASGQCVVVFTSPKAGTVTGHATVTIPKAVFGTAANVVRETDGQGSNSGDAVKHFLAGSIAWTKVDNAGAKQGGATFELCQTHVYVPATDTYLELVPHACTDPDILDNGPQDEDPDDGEFLVSGLALGIYTVQETIAPPGFVEDPDTETVTLAPGDSNKTIATAFVNSREVLKITGFGYENSAIGTPTSGVTNGTVTYTVNLHNYGTAAAALTHSSLVVTAPASANLDCGAGKTVEFTQAIAGTVAAGGDGGPYTVTCTYDAADGDVVTATLNVKSTTNGVEREASGSPATIGYTVQAD